MEAYIKHLQRHTHDSGYPFRLVQCAFYNTAKRIKLKLYQIYEQKFISKILHEKNNGISNYEYKLPKKISR